MLAAFGPTVLQAQQLEGCDTQVVAQLRVDQGHRWRPPFGLERVGSPPVVHVDLAASQVATQKFYVAAYIDDREVERQPLNLLSEPPKSSATESLRLFSHVPLASVPSEVAIHMICDGRSKELARETLAWPKLEADAVAQPDDRINPVDLGTVLVPHDWLLLAGGQAAVIEAAVLSRGGDMPGAKLLAWFTGGKPVEVALPLVRNQRAKKVLRVPLAVKGDHTVLHVSLTDGAHELWKKNIRTMIVSKPPSWPTFGAVETKLRYDAPIVVTDPKTGAMLPAIDYRTAWDKSLKDVVVFLPNGSRFVFWRGSSYVPFWAGAYNTGVNYQWAETAVPLADRDHEAKDITLEPLFDKELRYGRVSIIESSVSRIHVRWTYQLPDYRYKVWGDQAAEDFYFYPDGFGTRVLTAPDTLSTLQQVSEFIILTPQAAYPLEVLPSHMLDVLYLDGQKGSVTFPVEQTVKTAGAQLIPLMWPATYGPQVPRIQRIFAHKDDPTTAIYFHPHDKSPLIFFPPLYDEGELVTSFYWGNHWPLSRGGWTGWTINDRIMVTPSHNSLAIPTDGFPPGPLPEFFESVARSKMPDALGHPREMTTRRWAWLIAKTDAQDDVLLGWAHSFTDPPAIDVTGARIDFPSYSRERRAIRLVAESHSIEIQLKPVVRTVNPVFELDRASKQLTSVTIDGVPLTADAYAWDGATLWLKASIDARGAKVGLRFRSTL